MTALGLGLIAFPHSVSRVDDGGFLHDKTILLQPSNVTAGVGERNFVNFVGIQPDFTLAAFEDRGRETLLKFKRHFVVGGG